MTPTDVRKGAPEFANLTDPQIQIEIDNADTEICEAAWGSRARRGEIALARHLLIMNGATGQGNSGAAGPLTGAKAGEVSVNYAAPMWIPGMGLHASLMLSKYGLEYARLVDLAAFGADVLG